MIGSFINGHVNRAAKSSALLIEASFIMWQRG